MVFLPIPSNPCQPRLSGIGGVAAAIALGCRGHQVTVLENAPKVREIYVIFSEERKPDLNNTLSYSKSGPVSKSPQTCFEYSIVSKPTG